MNAKTVLKFNTKEFAQAFKDSLKFGDSITGISKEIGVSRNTIYRALHGNMIELESALRMAHYANISVNDFTNLTP